MDDYCDILLTMIADHRDLLTTDGQRSTFKVIEDVLVRTYMPAATIICNPFDDRSSAAAADARTRKNR